METLFKDYQKSILPSCDGASTVQLRLGIAVRQIVELVSPKFNTDEINSSCKYTPGNYSQLSLTRRPCSYVIKKNMYMKFELK